MYNNQTTFNPYAQNVAIVKNYFKKPSLLFLGILYCLSMAATIANSIVSSTFSDAELKNALIELCNEMGMYQEASTLENSLSFSLYDSVASIIALAPSLVLSILIIVAIFKIYSNSKNPNPSASPRGGFVILFIISLFQLIGAILSTVVLLSVVSILYFLVNLTVRELALSDLEFAELNYASIALTVLFVFIVICFVVLLVYSISKLKYTKSLKSSVSSATLSYKGAGSFGFFSILFAILDFLWLTPFMIFRFLSINLPSRLLNLETLGVSKAMFISFSVTLILTIVTFFVEAIIAFGYKRYIKKVTKTFSKQAQPMVEQPQPVYSAPVYNQSVAPTITPITCPQCGTTCKEGDSFCMSCGTKIK